MSQTSDPTANDNVYFVDHESGAEMARLMLQDRLYTKGMGGLFSEQSDLSNIHRILDIGCGPGGWALEVAFTYPEKEVVGFDISQTMIDYARAQARVQGLDNASFRVMDLLNPLDFPDNSFDLVNARLIAFLPTDAWPKLMQECLRITRPGGIIRLTECEWITNSPACEKLYSMFTRALKVAAQSFSPDGRLIAITPMLKSFLKDAGCQNVQLAAHVLDYSAGTEARQGIYQNWLTFYKLLQPFFVDTGVATQKKADQAYEQMQIEVLMENFRGIVLLLTAWGEKP